MPGREFLDCVIMPADVDSVTWGEQVGTCQRPHVKFILILNLHIEHREIILALVLFEYFTVCISGDGFPETQIFLRA